MNDINNAVVIDEVDSDTLYHELTLAQIEEVTGKARWETMRQAQAIDLDVAWDEPAEVDASRVQHEAVPAEVAMSLSQFLNEFREPLLSQINRQTPVVYNGSHEQWQDELIASLKRQPFPAQKHRIHAAYAGLVKQDLPAVFLNGEMGTGKTMMGICVSALIHRGHSQKPVLVISPPHLVYKWRREILDTVPEAVVHVVNGSNAIHELIKFRRLLAAGRLNDGRPHYLVIGRVRMRMGFHWKPAYWQRPFRYFLKDTATGQRSVTGYKAVACPVCGGYQRDREGIPLMALPNWGSDRREYCRNRIRDKDGERVCNTPLWSMCHKDTQQQDAQTQMLQFLRQLPGIGKVTADKLLATFGADTLARLIDDNIYDFINLCDGSGNFVFNDKHAQRLEKALGRLEFALRMVSYQPSEFVKRYFPRKAFSLALVDEAHEYKNAGSAQGQAMAVLCGEAEKVLCLTGTLMGGYASDLYYLLFRAMPGVMKRMGFGCDRNNSFAASEERYIHEYGCLKVVYNIDENSGTFRTSRAKRCSSNMRKMPGFSPLGIARFILPYTVFMRLSDLGEGVLPAFCEETRFITMSETMRTQYQKLSQRLQTELQAALAKRDNTLTAVVINALLRWPETCFRAERVTHPRHRDQVLAEADALFDDLTPTPKEQDIIDVCLAEQAQGRRVMVYTVYTGGHDTAARLARLLKTAGLRAMVLRSTVASDAREDWVADKVEQGIDVLICNPELVKTGLDLLAFPTIYFAQTGYNVYTVAQASRRSWRIGQQQEVRVYYACYSASAQMGCMELMAKKIKTALSTMGVMPETTLDDFIDEEDGDFSLTESLAKSLLGYS